MSDPELLQGASLERLTKRADDRLPEPQRAAGAPQPEPIDPNSFRAGMAKLAGSIKKGVPMISVPDIAATLDWYAPLGFEELGRHQDDGVVNFGMLAFGKAQLMLRIGQPGRHALSFWFYTERVDDLYRLLKSRQLEAAPAARADRPGGHDGIELVEDIYDPFYGGRQLSIRDLNGYTLVFLQPARK